MRAARDREQPLKKRVAILADELAVGATGTLIGMQLASTLPQQTLRRAFAVFLMLMGAYIITRTAPQLS